jgi:HSP20 family protein
MVDRSPNLPTHSSDWWPNLADPLRQFGSKVSEFFAPAAEASASEDDYVVKVELPGVKEADINVEIHDNVLSVRGEKESSRKEEGKTYYFSERTYGSFQRSFRLPQDVLESDIKADFEDGVLTVRLPKRPEAVAKARKIEIRKA